MSSQLDQWISAFGREGWVSLCQRLGLIVLLAGLALLSSRLLIKRFNKMAGVIRNEESKKRVIKVLEEVAEELRNDPRFKDDILEPAEILGLDRFEDSAVMIQGRIKTKPARQWRVGRELNLRVKKRFDRLGIQLPFPARTVCFGNLSKTLLQSVANAKEDQNGKEGS